MKNLQSALVSAVVFLACQSIAQAVPVDYTLLAENNFSGRVSQVILADWEWINVGDVVAGTRFSGDFALYDTGENDGSMHFQSNYTFLGAERDYTFSIGGGPFSFWGELDVDTDRRLDVSWKNNFHSDGLERTFHNNGNDYGYFDIVLNNYATPGLSGSGSFGWEGIKVDFDIGPAESVPEPSSLVLLAGGLLACVAARRRR